MINVILALMVGTVAIAFEVVSHVANRRSFSLYGFDVNRVPARWPMRTGRVVVLTVLAFGLFGQLERAALTAPEDVVAHLEAAGEDTGLLPTALSATDIAKKD